MTATLDLEAALDLVARLTQLLREALDREAAAEALAATLVIKLDATERQMQDIMRARDRRKAKRAEWREARARQVQLTLQSVGLQGGVQPTQFF